MPRYPRVAALALVLAGGMAPVQAHAQFWEEWDLATRPGDITIYAGDRPGTHFGDVYAGGSALPGDVNGDGIDDIAVNQCLILGSRTLSREYDLKGTVSTPPTTRFTVAGDTSTTNNSFCIYGDLNGDGKDELSIDGLGRSIVVLGRDAWPAMMTLSSTNSLRINVQLSAGGIAHLEEADAHHQELTDLVDPHGHKHQQ